jgi:hypothetical protein
MICVCVCCQAKQANASLVDYSEGKLQSSRRGIVRGRNSKESVKNGMRGSGVGGAERMLTRSSSEAKYHGEESGYRQSSRLMVDDGG